MLTMGTPLPAWPRLVPGPLTAMPSAWAHSGCQNMTLASSKARGTLGQAAELLTGLNGGRGAAGQEGKEANVHVRSRESGGQMKKPKRSFEQAVQSSGCTGISGLWRWHDTNELALGARKMSGDII
jgi:hypothetical protein